MEQAPWTPGPWRLGHDGAILGPPGDDDDLGNPSLIGNVREWHEQAFRNQSLANARLIAAAPEMAELLKQYAGLVHSDYCGSREHRRCVEVRTLLARIRGAQEANETQPS